MIAAEYFSNGRGSPLLDVVRIEGGNRHLIETREVSGKREARQICKRYGWKEWNF